MEIVELYDIDFAEWTRQNAELLRAGRASEADLAHIAEEIEDMGKRDRRSLGSHMEGLTEHLLKWQYQPERRGSSWLRTIAFQRKAIKRVLSKNPSFGPLLKEVVAEGYEDAADIAAAVIGCSRDEFPELCPWTLDQLLDDTFLP